MKTLKIMKIHNKGCITKTECSCFIFPLSYLFCQIFSQEQRPSSVLTWRDAGVPAGAAPRESQDRLGALPQEGLQQRPLRGANARG